MFESQLYSIIRRSLPLNNLKVQQERQGKKNTKKHSLNKLQWKHRRWKYLHRLPKFYVIFTQGPHSSLFQFYFIIQYFVSFGFLLFLFFLMDFRHHQVQHGYFMFQKRKQNLKRFSNLRLRSSVLLKLRSLDRQPQYHLGTCWKNKFSGSSLNLLSQTLLMSPSNLCLTSFPDDSEACSCLITTVTAQ